MNIYEGDLYPKDEVSSCKNGRDLLQRELFVKYETPGTGGVSGVKTHLERVAVGSMRIKARHLRAVVSLSLKDEVARGGCSVVQR